MSEEQSTAVADRLRQVMRYRVYPGIDGLPFRLPVGDRVPDLVEDDAQSRRPVEVYDGKVRMFDMGKPEDVEEYAKIFDLVAKGVAQFAREEVHWNQKTNSFCVFLRWMEIYTEMPRRLVEQV